MNGKKISSANNRNFRNYVNDPQNKNVSNLNFNENPPKKDITTNDFITNNSELSSKIPFVEANNIKSFVTQRGFGSKLRNSTSFGKTNSMCAAGKNSEVGSSGGEKKLVNTISTNANSGFFGGKGDGGDIQKNESNSGMLLNKLKEHKQMMKTSITCRNSQNNNNKDIKTSAFEELDIKDKGNNDNNQSNLNIEKIIMNVNIKENNETNKEHSNEIIVNKSQFRAKNISSCSHFNSNNNNNNITNKASINNIEDKSKKNSKSLKHENKINIVINSKDKENNSNNGNLPKKEEIALKQVRVKNKSISSFNGNKSKLEPILQLNNNSINKDLSGNLNKINQSNSNSNIKIQKTSSSLLSSTKIQTKNNNNSSVKITNYKKKNDEFFKKDPSLKYTNKYFNIQKLNSYYKTNGHLDKYVKKFEGNIQIPGEYFNVIYHDLLMEEGKYNQLETKSKYNYMKNQPDINEKMRSILIDWIIDIHYKFKFTDETLYMTVYIIDRYLSHNINNKRSLKIDKNNLQLLGITALLIACKHEEIDIPKINDFIYISDNIYTKNDVVNMEYHLLNLLNFNLLVPSPIKFYEYLAINFGFDKKQFYMGKYLMESFLLDVKYIKYNSSLIACACVYIVMKFFKYKYYKEIYEQKFYNLDEEDFKEIKASKKKYNEINVKECAKDICMLVDNIQNTKYKSCFKKFSNEEYEQVAVVICKNNK